MQIDLKNRQHVLVVTAIAVIGLFVLNLAVINPLTNAWKSRADRIKTLRDQVAQGADLIKRQPYLKSRWEQMRRNALPSDPTAAELQVFNSIDQWAQDARATIVARTPQWKHDADDYMTYECRVDVTGSLDSLSRFVYNLERDPVAVKIDSLELSCRDKQGRQLTLGVQVSGLVLTPPKK